MNELCLLKLDKETQRGNFKEKREGKFKEKG